MEGCVPKGHRYVNNPDEADSDNGGKSDAKSENIPEGRVYPICRVPKPESEKE